MKKKQYIVLALMTLLWASPSLVFAGSAKIRWQANQENDLKEYRIYYGQRSRTYGPPIPVGKVTSYTIDNLTEGRTYYFAVTAVDTSDNESAYSREVSKTILDSVLPTVTITSPTTQPTYDTTQASLTLGGTASDNVGVTTVTWSNSRGGSGTVTGTTSWTASPISLTSGLNVITVTARDQAGNQSNATLTVTYTPIDASAPTVAITSPTTQPTYDTSHATLALGGTASDNVGVTSVTWSNSRGGSGTATGTTSWTASPISLTSGTNVITVTARDQAGNQTNAILTVTYTPLDTTAPAPPVGVTVE